MLLLEIASTRPMMMASTTKQKTKTFSNTPVVSKIHIISGAPKAAMRQPMDVMREKI